MCLALTMLGALAPGASAVVVHSGGRFFGVAPRPGVAAAAARASWGAAWNNLSYQGGPVLHSSDPYVIFWAPAGETIPSSWQTLIGRYFGDVATDSTKPSNVYSVARQFTDATGFADYRQSFDPATQVIQDTDPYPTTDAGNCTAGPCLTDSQIQSEISALIAAHGLPSDGSTSATEMPDGAPIYFVVLPTDVDVCFGDGSGTCASNDFCAYHSAYADGTENVLYAAIPSVTLDDDQDAKGCQWDGNSVVQDPSGSLADVALKHISHEDNETITDPLGTGWWNDWTGNEDGDNCNDYQTNANAFTPTLGGDAGTGTLYNQLIGGDPYYLQSEWSNGGSTCLMQPSAATIAPRFGVPTGPRNAGTALSFDPTASTGTYRFSSETWDWGDGSGSNFHRGRTLTPASHTYAAPGDYTVALTLVDQRGNLSTASEQVSVGAGPTAAVAASATQVLEGGSIGFDASGSTDSGASIVSYAWDFGEGATDQGASPTHTYATPGTYLVRLTVTDSLGRLDTATQTITVLDDPPVAAFTPGSAAPEAGQAVTFDGSASSDSDGSIVAYSWSFGDGHGAGGRTPSHTYSTAGTYTVKLTVTDSSGQRASVSQALTVLPGPTARFTPSAGQAIEGIAIAFDATGSMGGGGGTAVTGYAWSFGDGSTTTVARPSHAYAAPGVYTVKLTVTDAAGASASTTQQVTVLDEPPTAAFSMTPVVPTPSGPVAFDARASSEPDGAIASYTWDFGDGATGAGATPTHAYVNAGTYAVRLTVVDGAGQRATVTHPVTVYSLPQSTFAYAPSLPVEGTATTFTAGPTTAISSCAWSFGDGGTAYGATVTHTYAHKGGYRVTLTVTSVFGLTTSTAEVVTVADAPPTPVIAVLSARPAPRHPVAFSGARSYDGDPIVSYLWRFGDRSGAVGRRLTHRYARAGTYRVSLTVRDSYGETATTSTTVAVGSTARDKPRRSHRRGRQR